MRRLLHSSLTAFQQLQLNSMAMKRTVFRSYSLHSHSCGMNAQLFVNTVPSLCLLLYIRNHVYLRIASIDSCLLVRLTWRCGTRCYTANPRGAVLPNFTRWFLVITRIPCLKHICIAKTNHWLQGSGWIRDEAFVATRLIARCRHTQPANPHPANLCIARL
jgi:hypothetical protein